MSQSPLAANEVLYGRYRIDSLIGRGRSAKIYKAYDEQTRSHVAIKMLDPFLLQDPVNIERFRREALTLSALSHPCIIKVFDLFSTHESHCIAMEYFEGCNLRDYLDRVTLDIPSFLGISKQIASAIETCHRSKVLHRDIKPQNILINERLEVKVVDFGISKMNTMSDLTKTGTFLGTPEYMAPETYSSAIPDPRLDVYSLGAVFYEMLRGRSPFAGLSIQQVMARQNSGEIDALKSVREDMPEWLQKVIEKCLRPLPRQRYHSVFELQVDLDKGDQSNAVVESLREIICCWKCKTDLVPGLTFCYQCGQWLSDWSSDGPYSVAVYEVAEPEALARHIEKTLVLPLASNWRQLLKRRPALLVKYTSEMSAKAVYHSLADLAVRAQVLRNLPRQLALPKYFLFVEVLLLAPLIYNISVGGQFMGALSVLAYTVFSQLPVFALYSFQTRSLSRLQKRQAATLSPAQEFVARWYPTLMEVKSLRVRLLLGTQLKTISILLNQGTGRSELVHAIERTFELALNVGRSLSNYEHYLASTTLNEIKERKREAELKIKISSRPEELDSLIQRKARLEGYARNYQEVQERFGQLYLSLMNFLTLLKRLEHATGEAKELKEECLQLAEDFSSSRSRSDLPEQVDWKVAA